MEEKMKNELNQALNQANLNTIQLKCREILCSLFSDSDFGNKNKDTKLVVLELCNNVGFPIKYEIKKNSTIPTDKRFKPITISVILGSIGIIISILSHLPDNYFINILGGLLTLTLGVGAGYYFLNSKIPPQTNFAVISTSDEIIDMINSTRENIMNLINLINESSIKGPVDIEILRWLQKLYSKNCRDVINKNLKEDIEELIARMGYEFFSYTPKDGNYFNATNANVTEASTSVPAMRNYETGEIVLRGRVVFPL